MHRRIPDHNLLNNLFINETNFHINRRSHPSTVAIAEAVAERLQGRMTYRPPNFRLAANQPKTWPVDRLPKTGAIKATATKIIVQSHLRNLSGTVIAGCTIHAMHF